MSSSRSIRWIQNNCQSRTGTHCCLAASLDKEWTMYSSGTARWMRKDPIGFEGSEWNLYEYVEGRPTVEFDPMGLGCKVCYNCILVGQSVSGVTKNCEYHCTEDTNKQRRETLSGACPCDNPNIPPNITFAKSVGRWQACPPQADTCRIHMEVPHDIKDCSRSQCRLDLKNSLRAMQQTCRLMPPGPLRVACNAVHKTARETGNPVCNACKHP